MAHRRAWWLGGVRGGAPRRRLPLNPTQTLSEHPHTTPVPAHPLAREEDGQRDLATVSGRGDKLRRGTMAVEWAMQPYQGFDHCAERIRR
jgi:hypothetical protein